MTLSWFRDEAILLEGGCDGTESGSGFRAWTMVRGRAARAANALEACLGAGGLRSRISVVIGMVA